MRRLRPLPTLVFLFLRLFFVRLMRDGILPPLLMETWTCQRPRRARGLLRIAPRAPLHSMARDRGFPFHSVHGGPPPTPLEAGRPTRGNAGFHWGRGAEAAPDPRPV